MILISNDFWHKIKMYNFDSHNVLLAIATNIAVRLMTVFMLQGHIYFLIHHHLLPPPPPANTKEDILKNVELQTDMFGTKCG